MYQSTEQARQAPLWRSLGRYDWANNVGVFVYACAAIVLPILLFAVMRDFGVFLQVGGKGLAASLLFFRNIAITLSLLLSGFASMYWGNRRCLRFAMLLSGSFLLLSAFSPNYWFLLLALVLTGIGEGLIEGLLTPFVQELHRHELKNCNRYVNLAHSSWPAGVIAVTLGGGLLLDLGLSWRWILGGVAALYFVPFLLLRQRRTSQPPAPKCAETTTTRLATSMRETLVQGRRILLRGHFWRFALAMFAAGGAELCLSFWASSFVRLTYGASAFIGGLSTALFAAGMLVGRVLTAQALPPQYMRQALLSCAILGGIASVFLALSTELWLFLLLLFLSGLFTAPYWPTIQVYTVQCAPELNSTLLYILLSASGVPGAGFFPWLLGFIGDHSTGAALASLLALPSSFGLSLLVVPVCHIVIFLLLLRSPVSSAEAQSTAAPAHPTAPF